MLFGHSQPPSSPLVSCDINLSTHYSDSPKVAVSRICMPQCERKRYLKNYNCGPKKICEDFAACLPRFLRRKGRPSTRATSSCSSESHPHRSGNTRKSSVFRKLEVHRGDAGGLTPGLPSPHTIPVPTCINTRAVIPHSRRNTRTSAHSDMLRGCV